MRLESITHLFDNRGIAGLHDLSLSLKPGEIFAVMGASGAGKSTLLRILAGMLAPEQGKVFLPTKTHYMGMDIPTNGQAMRVQDWLISGIRANLEDEKKIQLARDLAATFEFPLQLSRPLCDVSEGQRQRVRLAHALIDSPELLLLDEPFAHLDPILREDLLVLLKAYVKARDITVVWVTHQREEAFSLADRLGILHFGKWEQVDTPRVVFFSPRTLEVAKILGHHNFLTLSRESTDQPWSTPFGDWEAGSVGNSKHHLVLSLPPYALSVDEHAPWRGSVLTRRFLGHYSELTVLIDGHSWRMLKSGQDGTCINPGDQLRIRVDLTQAIGIDCL